MRRGCLFFPRPYELRNQKGACKLITGMDGGSPMAKTGKHTQYKPDI
ncbi:hypothetical protein HNR34_000268 [Geobacillus subterraneus]